MIPWANFDNGSRTDSSGDIRMQLHEHWLAWVEHGPSMTTVFTESPMLELAHERQFVVSQQGWDSAAFENEHTWRMQECLKQLEHHFHSFETNDWYYPRTVCDFDVMCCWKPEISMELLPPFTLSDSPTFDGSRIHAQEDLTPLPSLIISNSINSNSVSGTLTPGLEIDPDDEADNEARVFELSKLPIQRAGTILPIHGARASKTVRQRRRYDSKLKTEPTVVGKKRSSQWVTNEDEEDGNIAKRSQSITRPTMSPDTYPP